MGGWGSGNHRRDDARSTTDDYLALDVRYLARTGTLRSGAWGNCQWMRGSVVVASIQMRAESDRIVLTYRHRTDSDDWRDEEYAVYVVRTPCHLGGSRPWFICPGRECGRRVAILYGGGNFACRHCYRLAYVSSREDRHDRSMRRADRIRARLGWRPGILNGRGIKPKWMRWRTFTRLERQHDRFVNRTLHAALAQLRRLVNPRHGSVSCEPGDLFPGTERDLTRRQ